MFIRNPSAFNGIDRNADLNPRELSKIIHGMASPVVDVADVVHERKCSVAADVFEAETIIEKFEVETTSTFSIFRRNKGFTENASNVGVYCIG